MNGLEKCRICCCLIDYNEEAYNLLQLPEVAEMFTACTDLLVDPREDDLLPSKLCCVCYEELQMCHTFRKLCIEADTKWRLQKGDSAYTIMESDEMSLSTSERTSSPAPPIEDIEVVLVDEKIRGEKPCQILKNETKEKAKKKAKKRTKVKAKKVPPKEEPVLAFKCEICSKGFVDESRLQAHMRVHDGSLLFPCTEPGCDKSFGSFQALRVHLRGHDGSGTWYTCDQESCSRTYRNNNSLVLHKRIAHDIGTKIKLHVCEFCGKVMRSAIELDGHLYTHKDKLVRPHACEDPGCSKRFVSKRCLEQHVLRHRGIKNFTCPHCGLKKTTKSELRAHINIHTMERTFPCPHCPKVLTSTGARRMHISAIHEQAKNYACSKCDKKFTRPNTRNYHELTHLDERTCKCEVCGMAFIQPSTLSQHRKVHKKDQAQTPLGKDMEL
ncbi:zinc finger protein 93-like [Drosophila madeirensis]|uniref:Zinc finger protein 93-like n=1 Tax=Drosophila madeirensis TaxID=30013 RepID=A0AAU9FTH2_DROMD